MPRLTVLPHADLCPQGAEIEVQPGTSICDALLENGIPIEHACEKSCACTTCHVVVRTGFEALQAAEDREEDLLDRAWGVSPTSRLSCQMRMPHEHDLVIDIPRYTINQVRERH